MLQQTRAIPIAAGAALAGFFVFTTAAISAAPAAPAAPDCGAGYYATTGGGPHFAQTPAFSVQVEKPVTGAPYSGVGTTETVQTIADGNRIVHSNTTRHFRDSAGRTRTEYSISAIGPFTFDEGKTFIMVNDTVSGKHILLHPETKRAQIVNGAPSGGVGAGTGSFSVAVEAGDVVGGESGPSFSTACEPAQKSAEAVSLGEKTINGLKATGTRTERTIPAGKIGNELPITASSEVWVSKELGIVLASTMHDPMIGDTTYRLDQIKRAEPDAGLFKVPADYTVEQGDSHSYEAKGAKGMGPVTRSWSPGAR